MPDERARFVQDVFDKVGPRVDGPKFPTAERGSESAQFLTLLYKDGRHAPFFPWLSCGPGNWTASQDGRPESIDLLFVTPMCPALVTVEGFHLMALAAEITEGKRKVIEQHDERKAAALRRDNADAPPDKKQPIVLSIQMDPTFEQIKAAVKEAISELGKPAEGTGKSRGR